jgi:hypothetical protein
MIDACAVKLQRLYEGVYSGGKESFFSLLVDGKDTSETDAVVRLVVPKQLTSSLPDT